MGVFFFLFFSVYADVRGRRRGEHVPRERARTRDTARERERHTEEGISGGTLIEKARAKEREYETSFFLLVRHSSQNQWEEYICVCVPVDVYAMLP